MSVPSSSQVVTVRRANHSRANASACDFTHHVLIPQDRESEVRKLARKARVAGRLDHSLEGSRLVTHRNGAEDVSAEDPRGPRRTTSTEAVQAGRGSRATSACSSTRSCAGPISSFPCEASRGGGRRLPPFSHVGRGRLYLPARGARSVARRTRASVSFSSSRRCPRELSEANDEDHLVRPHPRRRPGTQPRRRSTSPALPRGGDRGRAHRLRLLRASARPPASTPALSRSTARPTPTCSSS